MLSSLKGYFNLKNCIIGVKIRLMFESVRYISAGKFISQGAWIHPDRTIDSYEIIFVIKGNVYINEGGKEYALKENDILLLEPNVRHFGYKKSEDTSFYWMHWSCETRLFPEIKSFNSSKPYGLSILFAQLLNYSFEGVPSELSDYTARLILGEIYLRDNDSKEIRIANTVSEWIKANQDRQIKVTDISENFGYNPDYISRLFRRAYRRSLKEYIDEARIEHIKNMLLNTSFTLNEISADCGFEEYKYFLKFFKYHTKMTPTEFLNVYSGTHINNK